MVKILFKYLFIPLCIALLSACDGNKSLLGKEEITLSKKKYPTIDIKDCTTARDTILESGDYIRYIQIDSILGIQVKFKGIIDTLDFFFDCNTTNILIPKLLYIRDDELFLKQAAGQNYRGLIAVRLNNKKKLAYTTYETTIVDYDATETFVYKVSKYKDRLYMYDIYGDKTSFVKIPINYQNDSIIDTEVYKSQLVVMFSNGKELKIDYKGSLY